MAEESDEARQDRELTEKARLLGVPGGTPLAMEALAKLIVTLKNALTAADRTATALSKRIVWLNVALLLLTVILVALEVFPRIYSPHGGPSAWVLWTKATNVTTSESVGYVVAKAYTTKADCDREAAKAAKRGKGVYDSAGRPVFSLAAVCLPDTVDPRGPKEK